MTVNRWLLLWESALTAFSTVSATMGLTDVLPSKAVALMVMIAQGLNMGTIVYKTGQWNPVALPAQPVHLTVTPTAPPDPPVVP